jgi:hypothetical protein
VRPRCTPRGGWSRTSAGRRSSGGDPPPALSAGQRWATRGPLGLAGEAARVGWMAAIALHRAWSRPQANRSTSSSTRSASLISSWALTFGRMWGRAWSTKARMRAGAWGSVGSPSTAVAGCTATPQARRWGLQVGSGPSGASAMLVTARQCSWRARAGERPSPCPIRPPSSRPGTDHGQRPDGGRSRWPWPAPRMVEWFWAAIVVVNRVAEAHRRPHGVTE